MGIEAANNLLIEANFSLNKFYTANSSAFNLFLSTIMKLQFFFCQRVSRFNSLKKRFGEFKNRVSLSLKYSRFFDLRSSQTRFLFFVYLVLLDGVRYQLYLLNAKFCRILFFITSLSNQGLIDSASFIFSLKLKTLTAVVSASVGISVDLSTSCSKVDSSLQCLTLFKFLFMIPFS